LGSVNWSNGYVSGPATITKSNIQIHSTSSPTSTIPIWCTWFPHTWWY